MPAKQGTHIIAVFGGTTESAAADAQALGMAIANETEWIVLTGGGKPSSTSNKVKERALYGPSQKDHRWIGVLQAHDDLPEEGGLDFVFRTPLGHKRNYLEACLCDGAIA